jgi:acetolactate synthase-1/2/3 large subunit
MKNGMPNFSVVSNAYSINGYRVENVNQLKEIILNNQLKNEPILLDVNVVENENCYPMVAPGRSNSQMLGLEKQVSISN